MRILMPVLWFDEVPGGWTYFNEAAKRLAKAGHEIIVISPHSGRQYSGPENIRVYRYPSIRLISRGFIGNFILALVAMGRVVKQEKPIDAVYDATSGILPMPIICHGWYRLRRRRVPIVTHIFGEMRDLRGHRVTGWLFEVYMNAVGRLCYVVSDKVLMAGERIRRMAVSLGTDDSKLSVLRPGIRYSDFKVMQPLQKEDIGLKRDDFTIGFVGRLTQEKGVDVLIHALSELKQRGVGAKLVLVGSDHASFGPKQLVEELGISEDVLFLGQRDDVPALLSTMDVFVNLSESEADISATQIEAMRAGIPSVVTSFSDLITNMEEALIVPRRDVRATTEALLRLNHDAPLREEMGRKALAKGEAINGLYSWDTYVRGVEKAFSEIC